ncbi:hypothetical protein FIBSPDRAFT_1035654 [Athelia psychrophila]|uniref:PHD-type domain-containing protein n=1 Tax=Athelia psychrophila TaxID=1759441 RepID=A0A166XD56_9AGAM|nr:hypothetical protein FIBSPDRAFT_1035654 [Fibularhizoctonia sp. CBS 109695]
MANTLAMGPPLSPRETRRSGRRSNQSSGSSKSPASPPAESSQLPPARPSRESSSHNSNHRPPLSTSNSNGRSKRPKQEDIDDAVADGMVPNGASAAAANGRGKRKTGTKQASHPDIVVEVTLDASNGAVIVPVEGEEEPSVTRCVCGSTVDEEGEFMVQCETCDVWQHGLCVGYENEAQVANIDYYCEQCRPDLHQELLRSLAKRARQSSATSHGNNNPSSTSRVSRSHSPSHLLKPAKRRNTMNSRDAAFDESLKEIIEATAIEAASYDHPGPPPRAGGNAELADEDGAAGKRKRKRTEDDILPKKRTRSASTASDQGPRLTVTRDDEQSISAPPPPKSLSAAIPISKSNSGARKSRGGRKSTVMQEPLAAVEADEAARPNKSRNAKPGPAPKRPPPSTANALGVSASHEHGTRQTNTGVNGSTKHGSHAMASAASEASRAYRNSHAYAVSQQPLFTSWGLPDYLAHLEPMLPTDTPRPLEVRASGVGLESVETGLERGAKVKWPSKRMSVGDMNKRVRALVEWVGKEQAGAMERGRRREAMEKALHENEAATSGAADGTAMAVDSIRPVTDIGYTAFVSDLPGGAATTMKQMEELMEEMISFQERFGPGAKISNERGRRIVSG